VHTEKAEIEYFRAFKNYLRTPRLMPKRELRLTPQALIDFVIDWKRSSGCFSESDNDKVWCVIDVDDFFDGEEDRKSLLFAIRRAKAEGIRIAYANECFELWILLHFTCPTAPIIRGKDIEKRIQDSFKKKGLGIFSKNQDVFQVLLPFQRQAIINSKKLFPGTYESTRWISVLGKKGNPSTNFHFLIEDILRLI
jgi:hypothetical protein